MDLGIPIHAQRGTASAALANEFGLSPVAERRLGSITPPDDESENPYGAAEAIEST